MNPYSKKETGEYRFIYSKMKKLDRKPVMAPVELILGKNIPMANTPPSPLTSIPRITLK
jgi:hypothetical protein